MTRPRGRTQLIQESVADGLYAVTRYQPQSDKVMRLHAQTEMIENGFVQLPKAAPLLAQDLHEMTSRSCSTGSNAAAAPCPTRASSELYRQRAEELRHGRASTVTLRWIPESS